MAISTDLVTDGVYCRAIVYDAGTLLADLIASITSVLTSNGWNLYDASAGTNAYVFRAVCKDGSTYKYAHLDFNTSGYVILSAYEDWDSGTHTGTNKAYNSYKTPNNAASATELHQRIDLTNGGILYISASVRWLWMVSFQSSVWGSATFNGATGIVEHTLAYPGDSTPPFCWIATGNMTYDGGSTTPYYTISFPRISWAGGQTGANAAAYGEWSAPLLGFSAVGYTVYSKRFTTRGQSATYAYDPRSTYLLCSPILVGAYYFGEVRGFLYGTMYLPSVGTWGDNPKIKVDSDYLYDDSGTLKDFFIICGGDTGLLRLAIPR